MGRRSVTDFIERLRQRKVVQWALAYGAAAFAVIQVLDIVVQRFGWPDLLERLVIVALPLGLVVTLVLVWYHGERGAQRATGTELLILALLFAIGGGALWRIAQAPPDAPRGTARVKEVVAPLTPTMAAPTEKSIAVLPFENLSHDADNAYFADGMQEEILTRLAGIGELRVISRTSTEKYLSHPDNLKTIAAELGVATILEGSVQKSGNDVRINVQLIDAQRDSHLWAQTFDRELNNVFAVESEVSQQIADVLKARLSPREVTTLAKAPTHNSAAFDAFLKAEFHYQRANQAWSETEFDAAIAGYRQAIALDPSFALAYAQLGYSQMLRHWFVERSDDDRLAEIRATIGKALALDPDLPDGHNALGFYLYWGHLDYDAAIVELQRVLELAPSDARALLGLAAIYRRKGEWTQSLLAFERGLVISPRDSNLAGEYGITFALLRRYADAEQQLRIALAIAPENASAKDALMMARLMDASDIDGARAAFTPPPDWRISGQALLGGDIVHVVNTRAYADVFARDFQSALHEWDSAPNHTEDDKTAQRVARVVIKMVAGQKSGLQAECAELKPLVEAAIQHQPKSLGILDQSSWVDLCLGRNEEAMRTARQASELLPLSKDAYFGVYSVEGLAEIDAQAGAADQALPLIEQLLQIPAGMSMTVERLKHDPVWDPIRADRRFHKLIADDASQAMK
jgi:TolB-like protein/Flp pilus assembly protein TadD